ncbi:MAG: hypothetical protein ACHREM_01730 [Polyangiales bacterium]
MDDHEDDGADQPPVMIRIANLDETIAQLRPLLCEVERRLLEPTERPAHDQLRVALEALPWGFDADTAATAALRLLTRATSPGGTLDPSIDDSDLPWCATIVRLRDRPDLGVRIGRAWYARLYRWRSSDVPVSVVLEAVSAHAVSIVERLRGRQATAAWWSRTASIAVEAEAETRSLDVVAYARAVLLLRLLIERIEREVPR